MSILLKLENAQLALNALLDRDDIHVNSQVGDALLPIISELEEAEILTNELSGFLKLNERELGAVLAGLRLLQCELPFDGRIPAQIEAILSNDSSFKPLDLDEIDELCISLNEANGPDELPAELNFELEDWQTEGNETKKEPLSLKLTAKSTRIDLSVDDGRALWIEQQNGTLRLHSYLPDDISDQEPVNLNIEPERITVSGKVTFEISS